MLGSADPCSQSTFCSSSDNNAENGQPDIEVLPPREPWAPINYKEHIGLLHAFYESLQEEPDGLIEVHLINPRMNSNPNPKKPNCFSNMLKVVIAVFLRRDLKGFTGRSTFILKGQCHENCFQTETVA